MYEYGWTYHPSSIGPLSSPIPAVGPGVSSGYYVGILQYSGAKGLGYFLTTQSNPQFECQTYDKSILCLDGYYDYYYSGSADGGQDYYFLEDNGSTTGYSGSTYFPFMPPDQQQNQLFDQQYSQYGLFWLYNWFQEGGGNMNIFFLMNGNIFNYSLSLVNYNVNGQKTYIIPAAPPENISTITGEPIFVQSYINAYNTAFNQPVNSQIALYGYYKFYPSSQYINSNFVPGTFGYDEQYNGQNDQLGNSITINYLQDNAQVYFGAP
jgi:hypothetical protein